MQITLQDIINSKRALQKSCCLLCVIISPGIFLEKLLRGGKIEIFVSKGGHACVRVHALIVCVPVLIINVCVPA